MLARVCRAIADGDGLIGDIQTISIGAERSIRDVSVEVRDIDQAHRLAEIIASIDEVRVIDHHDRAIDRHVGGKIEVVPRIAIASLQDLRDVYVPGVARVCRRSRRTRRRPTASRGSGAPSRSARTARACSASATSARSPSMPVMEGKAIFYTAFADLNAVPILDRHEARRRVRRDRARASPRASARSTSRTSGVPECFEIEQRLIEALDIPVMHDDVHGTAVAALAAIMGACAQAGLRLDATRRRPGRARRGRLRDRDAWSSEARREGRRSRPTRTRSPRPTPTRTASRSPTSTTVMARADIVVATTGRPGLIGPEMIREGQVDLRADEPRARDRAAGRAARRRRVRRRRRGGQQRARASRASSSARSPAARGRSRPG